MVSSVRPSGGHPVRPPNATHPAPNGMLRRTRNVRWMALAAFLSATGTSTVASGDSPPTKNPAAPPNAPDPEAFCGPESRRTHGVLRALRAAGLDPCNGPVPYPGGVPIGDHDAEPPRVVTLRNGYYECVEREGDPPCGGIALFDALWVDFDGDGRKEVVLAFDENNGGSHTLTFIHVYRVRGRKLVHMAALESSDEFANSGTEVLALRRGGARNSIRLIATCNKFCHGCDGNPCWYEFQWRKGKAVLARSEGREEP